MPAARSYYRRDVVRHVLLASPRGYCAGVERAVDTVEQALEALRAARVRPAADRAQHARRAGPRASRRGLRRERGRGARGRAWSSSPPTASRPSVHERAAARPADDRRHLPAGDEGALRGPAVSPALGYTIAADRTRRARRGRGHDRRGARRDPPRAVARRMPSDCRAPRPARGSPTSRRRRSRWTRRRRSSPSCGVGSPASSGRGRTTSATRPSNRQRAVKALLARGRPRARDRLAEQLELAAARRGRPQRRRPRAPDRGRERDRRALARRASRPSASPPAPPRPSGSSASVCDWFRARGVVEITTAPLDQRGRRRSACRCSRAAGRRARADRARLSASDNGERLARAPVRSRRRASRERSARRGPRRRPRARPSPSQRISIRSVISRPESLRRRWMRVDHVERSSLESERRVELGVERDRDEPSCSDRPAVGAEICSPRRPRPARARCPRKEHARPRGARRHPPRAPHGRSGSSWPSFGPSTGRFGFSAQRRDPRSVSKPTSFTRSSSRISSTCVRRPRGALAR